MAETDFKYDVFISYSHKDEKWVVNTLLRSLEDAGLKVCIDFRDFVPGKPSRHNMRDACKESAYTVLVMTRAWMASEWTLLETLLTFLHDPSGKRQRTVPLLLENCDIPEDISFLTYIDFVRKDREAIAWKRLLFALSKTNTQTIEKPYQDSESNQLQGWFLAHPYPMSPNFTGRHAEKNMLTGWLNNDKEHPMLILRALGGFGKSSLAWQWLTQDVDASKWSKVIWWSFYEGDSSFESFLKHTLKYIDDQNSDELNPHQRIETLINLLQRKNVLLILDGFERALRAYSSMNTAYQGDELQNDTTSLRDNSRECINIYADTFLHSIVSYNRHLQSKVLMTTRLTPSAVEFENQILQGCLEVELTSMNKADAVAFFRARGVRGPGAEIEDLCASYGYHPLSLRLLAGSILSSSENNRDIAVARKLNITDDIIQNKHHVLKHAYDSLTQTQQTLLSDIACFRSSIDYKTLQVIIKKPETFDNDLDELVERGLLHHTKLIDKYDLHPIVRRYAYERMTQVDRISTHTRLLKYFAVADTSEQPQTIDEQPQTIDDLSPLIELYHHSMRAGELDRAVQLFLERLATPLYFQFGAHEIRIGLLQALFSDGDKLPHLKDKTTEALVLNILANSYSATGQPRRAVPLLREQILILEGQGDQKTIAIGLENIAQQQFTIGSLHTAQSNLRRSIQLCQEITDEFGEAVGHQELGRMLAYCGLWDDAENELSSSTKVWETKVEETQGLGLDEAYRSLRALLITRDLHRSMVEDFKLAILHARHALELAKKRENETRRPNVHDFIRANWLLGAAYRLNGQFNDAEIHLSDALTLDRTVNMVDHEGVILLDLARLRYEQEKYEEAKSLAEEALSITERCGYVLQGADVNLFLAQFALKEEKDEAKAKKYAESAKKLAYCDGPPYYYKVAYHEAERLLKAL